MTPTYCLTQGFTGGVGSPPASFPHRKGTHMDFLTSSDKTTFYFEELHVNCNGPEGGYASTTTSFEVKDDTVTHKWYFSSTNGEEATEFDDVFVDNIDTKEDALNYLDGRIERLKEEIAKIEKLKAVVAASDFVSATDKDDNDYRLALGEDADEYEDADEDEN